MADNYLEKRYEATLGSQKPKVKRVGPTLDDLLLRARSCRGYNQNYVVKRAELERIVAACGKIGSAKNQQLLRFRLVTRGPEADMLNANIKLGAMLPEPHLPLPGTEPQAFIVVCAVADANRWIDIDLGMALQTIMLKTAEMGLNSIIIGAFNRAEVRRGLNLELEPQMVVAVGKGIEHYAIDTISPDESHAYYRRDGIHHIPKIGVADLIID
ncbi:MAG: nitroreductase family protein [Bacteroidales bacterium]|nr:nitroreductase family protein [Bacteroidales bacterium]